MNTEPIIIETSFNTPVQTVWEAISNKENMKHWYFDLTTFIPEKGFSFSFMGGPDGRTYKHLCVITDVVKEKKLSYSWCYDGYEGNSEVTFELLKEANGTKLRLTHSGLESFPPNPDFAKENFVAGWTHIILTSLPRFLGSIKA